MRAVVQRVNNASVTIDGKLNGKIGKGLLVLLGVGPDDTERDLKYMCDKILGLRIFEDEDEKMNLSLRDISGELMVVSQFTLFGDCRKGKRPSFAAACPPDRAEAMYKEFLKLCENEGFAPQHGEFGADMKVALENDGPVTILIDSEKVF